jgi:hypothetical protein
MVVSDELVEGAKQATLPEEDEAVDVAERTVSRPMPKRRPSPSQTWRTFLTNHVRDLVSIDFFTVPTVHLRVLSSSSCSPTIAGAWSTST